MTNAERQRRHRKKVRKQKLRLGKKAERERKRLKAAEAYIPTPPGITYWKQVTIQTAEGARQLMQPLTRPLASMEWHELDDADLDSLREHLDREARRRSQLRGAK